MPYKTANAGDLRFRRFRGGDGRRAEARRLVRLSGSGARSAQRAGKLRGIGIATYLEAGGGGGGAQGPGRGGVRRATASMTLFAVTQSSGQGHETIFPQIVAETLGIDPAHIRFHPRPPAAELVGNGTGGSRGVLGTGSAFRVLGEKLIERRAPARGGEARRAGKRAALQRGQVPRRRPLDRLHRARARARRPDAASARTPTPRAPSA